MTETAQANAVVNGLDPNIPQIDTLYGVFAKGMGLCQNSVDAGPFTTHGNWPYLRTTPDALRKALARARSKRTESTRSIAGGDKHWHYPAFKDWFVMEIMSGQIWTAAEFIELHTKKKRTRKKAA